MRVFKRVLAAMVSLVILLSFSVSCLGLIFVPLVPNIAGLPSFTLTEDYVEQTLDFLESAKNNTINNSDVEASADWTNFNYSFYEVASQTNVAYIFYVSDTSNSTYRDNYVFANDAYNEIYSSYMKALQAIYEAQGAEGALSSFSKDELNRVLKYTDKVAELEKEVSDLQMEYASIDEDAENYNEETAKIYKQIVIKNNQIAQSYGFTNYYEYASNYIYDRDYSVKELASFRTNVSNKVPGVIARLKNDLKVAKNSITSKEEDFLKSISYDAYYTTSTNYWEGYVASYEAEIESELTHAFDNQNVMFANGANSREMAFTAHMPAYNKSFCYFGPKYQDVFTVAHEIGHYFAGRHVEQGTASMDLKETHSQGNEMLLLNYLSNELDESSFKVLELAELSSILSTVLVCTIIDEFEYHVYTNDVNSYTSQDFDRVINNICARYGGDAFVRNITDINKYWRLVVAEQPLYYISYATSGVAAFSLYVMADENTQTARNAYVKLIQEHNEEGGFVSNLTRAGFTSPFTVDSFVKIENFVYAVS